MKLEKQRLKRGTTPPNDGITKEFFKMPNRVVDVLMRLVTGVQFKVFICIWRSTVGFHQPTFSLSLRQLAGRTGISRDSAIHNLRFWERSGLIKKIGQLRGGGATVYRIAAPREVVSRLKQLAEGSGQSNSSTTTGRRQRPSLEGFFDPIKENFQRNQKTNYWEDLPDQITNTPSPPADGLPTRGMEGPEGAFTPEPDPWKMVQEELKSTMNPLSYQTWIDPTWLAYALNRTLFVHVPNGEWEHVREQFGAKIMDALKKLGLPYEEFVLEPIPGRK